MCQDGKIPLEKFIEILEEDPVWKESVPKPLKDKIIEEVWHVALFRNENNIILPPQNV